MTLPVRFPLQILLLLSISLPLITSDPVRINIAIKCEGVKHWCGKVSIYEQDHPKFHDDWFLEEFCSNDTVHKVKVGPLLPKGDYSPEYEIGLQLTHDCSSDRILRCLEPPIRHVSVANEVTINYNMSVFQMGNEGACLLPNDYPMRRFA